MPLALLDSNVVIAMVVRTHEQHAHSFALLAIHDPMHYAIAAHSYAEAYSTLTRAGIAAPFPLAPQEAAAVLDSVRAVTTLIGLTPSHTFDAIARYAAKGGIGARLYDALIGEVAVAHRIPTIITWNAKHMAGLFPDKAVMTPSQFLHHATSHG